jgi:hypothetical protein
LSTFELQFRLNKRWGQGQLPDDTEEDEGADKPFFLNMTLMVASPGGTTRIGAVDRGKDGKQG